MNYQETLEKLEKLLEGYRNAFIEKSHSVRTEDLALLYGELEEVIHRFAGRSTVVVRTIPGQDTIYPNYIEARIFSSKTFYTHEGYTQLLKIIGKVRQHANDPTVPEVEYSVTNLVQILYRFRECCQYLASSPQSENEIQGILWIMLRAHFDRLEKEETLPRFGVKNYRPDFGIPDLRVLVEVKFIGPKTNVSSIQEGILADIPGYLKTTTNYDAIVVLVYDAAHKLRDSRKFVEDLKSAGGIVDVIIIPGIG